MGTEVPQRGPRPKGKALVGVWGPSPQKLKKHCKLYTFEKYFCVTRGVKASTQVLYKSVYKLQSTNMLRVYQPGVMKAKSQTNASTSLLQLALPRFTSQWTITVELNIDKDLCSPVYPRVTCTVIELSQNELMSWNSDNIYLQFLHARYCPVTHNRPKLHQKFELARQHYLIYLRCFIGGGGGVIIKVSPRISVDLTGVPDSCQGGLDPRPAPHLFDCTRQQSRPNPET